LDTPERGEVISTNGSNLTLVSFLIEKGTSILGGGIVQDSYSTPLGILVIGAEYICLLNAAYAVAVADRMYGPTTIPVFTFP
jgi:hypothetical protein